MANNILEGIAGHGGKGLININNGAGRVGDHHGFIAVLVDQPCQLQGFLVLLAAVDVSDNPVPERTAVAEPLRNGIAEPPLGYLFRQQDPEFRM